MSVRPCNTHLWVVPTERQVNSCVHTSFPVFNDWGLLLGVLAPWPLTPVSCSKNRLSKLPWPEKAIRQRVAVLQISIQYAPEQCVPKRHGQGINRICYTIIRDRLGWIQSAASSTLFHKKVSRALNKKGIQRNTAFKKKSNSRLSTQTKLTVSRCISEPRLQTCLHWLAWFLVFLQSTLRRTCPQVVIWSKENVKWGRPKSNLNSGTQPSQMPSKIEPPQSADLWARKINAYNRKPSLFRVMCYTALSQQLTDTVLRG